MGHTWNPTPARTARKAQRLTQEEVAAAVGVERKAITRWEGGTAPTVDRAADLADFLGLSLDSLVAPVIEEERATPSTARGTKHPHNSADVDVEVTSAVVGASPKG